MLLPLLDQLRDCMAELKRIYVSQLASFQCANIAVVIINCWVQPARAQQLPTDKAAEMAEARFQLLLSYCTHICVYLLLKAEGNRFSCFSSFAILTHQGEKAISCVRPGRAGCVL
jgi:hypothetical protein